MAAEELQTSIPKVISFLRRSKGSYDFAFSNVGRLDMPDNYQAFRVEGVLGVTVAVPWRKRNHSHNNALSRAYGYCSRFE